MPRIRWLPALLLVGFVLAPPTSAHAALGFSLFGDLNFANLNAKDAVTGADLNNHAKLGFGGGLGIDLPLGSRVAIGIGLQYDRLTYHDPRRALDFTFTRFNVPVLLRVFLARPVFISVGGYYNVGLGGIRDSQGDTYTYAPLNRIYDYGLVTGVGFHLGRILLEGRYYLGLAENSANLNIAASQKWTNIQILFGILLGAQSK
ncbi:MAG: outer membrane beta-barrel protein [Bacteriovoracia bacterium]